ncbi:MAG: hypothetical protein R3F14_38345 [Polyangiaceae bacterium]
MHAPLGLRAGVASDVLAAAESALSGYRALGFPMPLADAARGGSPAWDVYIGAGDVYTADAADLASALGVSAQGSELFPDVYTSYADVYTGAGFTVPDPETEPRPLDQAAAYTLFPEPATRGCELSFALARHAAEAILLGLDSGAERGFAAAASSYLASIVAPCAAVEAPAIDAFQARPHRAITAPAPGLAHGGMLFPMHLEESGGSGNPGELTLSLFAIAAQHSEPSALFSQNEPDTFDSLRSSLRVQRSSVDDLLLAFAVNRAFVGDRSDGQHLAATDLYDKAGRVFFEWSVPFSSLPRRLAPARPLEPTGATYLWLDLASAPKDSEVTFVADWELPAVFRWSIVKVDKDGAETGRVDIAGIFGETHVERTVVLTEPLAGLLVAGTFTGSLDRTLPFDPDDAPHMPHSYEVTFYGPLPAGPGTSQ